MGFLHVDLVSAANVYAADRSGTSDPYVEFVLDGKRVFKSKVMKKTLNPVWDESFDVMIPSRTLAFFYLELYDWNQVQSSELLGTVEVPLKNLEPFERHECNYTIS